MDIRSAKMWAVDCTAVVHGPFSGYLLSLPAQGEQRKLFNISSTLSGPVCAGPRGLRSDQCTDLMRRWYFYG